MPKKRPTKKDKEAEAAKSTELAEKMTRTAKSPVIDIFDPKDNTLEVAHKALNDIMSARANRMTPFTTVADIPRAMINLPHWYLRWFFGCWGIPHHCLIDLIGTDGIGKTTLGLSMVGWAIQYAAAFGLWIETESKPMLDDQILRLFNTDYEKARVMMNKALTHKEAHSLDEMFETLEEWVLVMRGIKSKGKNAVSIPWQQPLVVFVDTLSKLMTPAEAAGFYNYAQHMTGKDVKEKKIGEGSNLGFSKFVHEWMRKLPGFLAQYNVLLIISHHQNEKINMNGFGLASFMTEDVSALYNKTKIGGRATNQNAAYQLIMSNAGVLKDSSGAHVGKIVKVRMEKNSYGQHGKVMQLHLKNYYNDSPGYREPVLQLDHPFLLWSLEHKYFEGLKFDAGKWSCPQFGVYNGEAHQLMAALNQNNDLMTAFGKRMRIHGYYDPVAEFLAQKSEVAPTA